MKKLVFATLVAMLVMVLLAPTALAKPEMDKPLPATDVELVKKVTLHSKPGGGSKPAKPVATGFLGANASGSKYAIVIGISDYPGTGNDLEYCDDDAQEMHNALTVLYGYDEGNIHLLLDMGADFTAIRDAISDIESKEADGDEVVFFFSGHGGNGKWSYDNTQDKLQGVDSNGIDEAIVCHDGKQNGELKYIWDGQLREWFADFQTSRIIFIFDSCRAGGMSDLRAPGRIVNMACSENGVSLEGDSWGNGQFTYYFVDQGMLRGQADKYDNLASIADVTIEEAFDYAKANCQKQTPAISDSFPNDLLL